jgi:hypothetical protein
MSVLTSLPVGVVLYERAKLDIVTTIPYIPDFFLPEAGIIIEAKGLFNDPHEKAKAVAMANALPFDIDGVMYYDYIVAVAATYKEIAAFDSASGMIQNVAGLSTRSMPLKGLALVKWLDTHGVSAVPVARDSMHWLRRKIARKIKRRNRDETSSV